MQIRTLFTFIIAGLLLLAGSGVRAAGVPTIVLRASRVAVLNDGRDYTEIIAEVRDSSGSFVPDGTPVTFSTNLGQFGGGATIGTRSGTARVRLTSQQKGTATITAAVGGGGFQKMDVVFTDDPTETFQGNTYVAVQSTGALLYSAGHRIIEATGKPRENLDQGLPGAHLSYRNIEVFADSLQVDCTGNVVRANGSITLRRGNRRLQCGRLYYPLTNGDGYAVSEVEEEIDGRKIKRLRPVIIRGNDLRVEPAPHGIAPKFFEFEDLSEAPLIITARQILLFPGEKLQFKRPHFYQEGQRLFSVPFYSLGLFSTQLFTDQLVTIGSQGLGVDIPLYYDMTPSSTGVFRIRHGERTGRSVYATRPGWSLDLLQSYNSVGGGERRFTGEFGFTGLSRSDWGFRWSHSQEFSPTTRGSLFLDFPQHRSVYLSTNLNRQMGALYMGLNLSANRSLSGFNSSGLQGDVYVETTPRKVGKTGLMYAVGGTATAVRTRALNYTNNSLSQGIHARFYSQPFRLDHSTSLTSYVTIGNLWSNQSNDGLTALASLSATRTFGSSANLQLTYDFTRQPTFLTGGGSHRLSANFFADGGNRWNFYFFSSVMLDAPTASLFSDLSYSFAPRWRFSLSATLQRFASGLYRDFEFGIARSIGGRDLVLSYSTFTHRIFFDIEASRF